MNSANKVPAGFNLRHTLQGHDGPIGRIAWSPDGEMLATPSSDRTVRVWNTKTGKEARVLREHGDRVISVAWDPSGKLLAASSDDRSVCVWHSGTGDLAAWIKGYRAGIAGLAWSPRGKALATGCNDGTIKVWEIGTWRVLHDHATDGGPIFDLAWCHYGEYLAYAAKDRRLNLWMTGTPHGSRVLEGHKDSVLTVAWSETRQTLASGSCDTTLRLWNLENVPATKILRDHEGPITCVRFLSDGRLLASKSRDGTIRVWRMDSFEPVAVLHEPGSPLFITGIAFHPTSPVLATLGEGDMVVRIWDLDVNVLLTKQMSTEDFELTKPEMPEVDGEFRCVAGLPNADENDARYIYTQQEAQELSQTGAVLKAKKESGKFDVFLCYNSEDRPAVKKIGRDLEQVGIWPWLDERELRPGLPWQRSLEKQIERISSAAVFVGDRGIGPWQQGELEAFLHEFVNRGCPVIPVLLPNAPSEPKLPIFLKNMTWVDFRKNDPDPMQQLIWGITGKRCRQ